MMKTKIVARVIPDGFQRENSGKASSFRVSLALMPDFREGLAGGAEVDIENWPKQIWEISKDLKLFASTDPNAGNPSPIKWYARGNIAGDPGPKEGPLSKEF